MVNILIIGYKGYIGSFLYENLKKREIDLKSVVHGYDRKTGSTLTTLTMDEQIQYADIVIYMAGITGRKQCSNKSPQHVFSENVDDIMKVAYKMKSGALLAYASTAALYEGCGKIPAKENHLLDTELFDEYTRSMYWREKNIGTLTHIRTVGLRMGTVIGLSPNQRTNFVHIALLRSAVLTGIARVYGANQNRAVLWNRDLLLCVEHIICQNQKLHGNEIYNVSSLNCTISKIANEVGCKTGCRVLYETEDSSVKYNLGFSMDTTKVQTDFGIRWAGKNSTMIEELTQNLKKICVSPEYLLEAPPQSGECCRICKTTQMYVVYDFGLQPSANHYLKTTESVLPEHPLRLDLCKNCYHTQLHYTVPPSQMFSDYIYMSGTSRTMRQYFDDFAVKTVENRKTGAVLDIACNDGSLLDAYKQLGWNTYGYDPAKNIYDEISSKKGHSITVGFWGIDPVPEYPPLDIIVAQNVVAHVPDPILFMQKCADIMSENTVFYIQTSQAEMIERGQFDTIYHEHLSFFTVKSMMEATRRTGLYIENVEKTQVHGISYVFKIRKGSDPRGSDAIMNNEVYLHEENIGLYDDLLYHVYIEKIKGLREWVCNELIDRFGKKNIPIIGYGAAAKGMTVLNYIGKIPMKYIVDDSPYKHNYYATNHKYLIVPPEELKKEDGPLAIIVFAWNFIEEIQSRIQQSRGDKETYLIVYYPRKQIIRVCGNKVHKLYDEIDTRYTNNSLYHKTLLFTHFYNEEMLLKQWIRHHAPLFDSAVLINHHSTDSSVEIIRQEAPDNWNIVLSGTKVFCPYYTDSEVASYENSFQNDDWRLALTTTEFLFQTGLRRKENPIFSTIDPDASALRFPALTVIDGSSCGFLNMQQSLVQQRNACYIPNSGTLDSTSERYLHGQYNRFMHKIRDINPYMLGRHEINHPYVVRNGFILKYMYSPYPEFCDRKLQIKHKIMKEHKEQNLGFQHLVEYNDLSEQIVKHQNLPTMHLDSSIDDKTMYQHIRYFDEHMDNVYNNGETDQLLGGMYENMYPNIRK
jgi:nucleoside-diphosphate-sugar epimerase/2-polyprenyl-3-methyl-5-hydroxy-6-metoxy-1,4-benzoquinol methylase